MMAIGEMWSYLGSATASFMFIYAITQQYFPLHFKNYIETYVQMFVSFVYPYIQITFDEFTGERMKCSEAFSAVRIYLKDKSSASAKRLKADVVKDSQSVVLSMDYNEQVTEEFQGVKIWWTSSKTSPSKQISLSIYPSSDERRHYQLKFHKRHRKLITESYISHVLEEGKTIAARNRQRKLYTNNPSDKWYGYKRRKWSEVDFEHPSSFDTLAMETKKKEQIKKDLIAFSKGKGYYVKIGKAWKRGYLLYGPPGTGKSSMIAAMANLLNYDVYDLELTTIKDNTELKRLLIDTSNKSIIVIEDIDYEEDADTCLKNLIEALMESKEKARKKAEEEAQLKEEKEKEEQCAKEKVGEDATTTKGIGV
ncbi:hypothetical protein SLEP1_g10235 [Rubroshorea leprosula]|uniref:Uncharacterized protein n=1 Tax=Rubroshorea leprosula TaxID=152421 RepID=A0AAV5IGV5_9ROSI|nr:hypothetical protein SLEP1_g10235 [Rubroshorea leprosula]